MASLKQINFDTKKWLDSQKNQRDMCGEYEYCVVCNKTLEYPCEKAYSKYHKMNKINRAKAKTKFNINGKELNFRSTILEKQ